MAAEGAVYENLFSKAGLSLERLKTFIEVVEARGFTAAAKGDPTRQSQYSRQVRELEAYFGVELLVREQECFSIEEGIRIHDIELCCSECLGFAFRVREVERLGSLHHRGQGRGRQCRIAFAHENVRCVITCLQQRAG